MIVNLDDIITEIIDNSKVVILTVSAKQHPLPKNYEGPTGIKNCKRIVQLARTWPNVKGPDEIFEYYELVGAYLKSKLKNAYEDDPSFFITRESILSFLESRQ